MRTFEQYLRDEIKEGKIDFSVRASGEEGMGVRFYIHAYGKNSTTMDFNVHGNALEPIQDTKIPNTIVYPPVGEKK